MGIVDSAARLTVATSVTLAGLGVALAAPWLEAKDPRLASTARAVRQHRKISGGAGMAAGALGLVLVPILLLVMVGFGGLMQSLPLLAVAFLELIGCLFTVVVGLVFRAPDEQGPHGGELDVPTLAGLGAIAYGGFLMFVFFVAGFLT